MDSDESRIMAARVQFVKSRIHPEIENTDKEIKHLELTIAIVNDRLKLRKSRIHPEIEDADKQIKHLELLIAIMNGKMKLLTAHRKSFQDLENIVMTRGDFTPQDDKIKIDDDDDDDDGDDDEDDDDEEKQRSRRLNRMVSVLNKHRKLLGVTTSTPEVKVEHLKGEKTYNTGAN